MYHALTMPIGLKQRAGGGLYELQSGIDEGWLLQGRNSDGCVASAALAQWALVWQGFNSGGGFLLPA